MGQQSLTAEAASHSPLPNLGGRLLSPNGAWAGRREGMAKPALGKLYSSSETGANNPHSTVRKLGLTG